MSHEENIAAASRRELVLLELARRDKTNMADTFHAITEASAVVVDVDRVSIWRLRDDDSAIVCEDGYQREPRQHTSGETLLARDYPAYFRALLASRVLTAHDARTDPRTREFADTYLLQHGISSMMDVPIWHRGRLYGVLCHEHVGPARRWSSDNETFAANLADLVALTLEAGERREAERRWRAVVDAIAEAVFVIDPEGRVVDSNPAGEHIRQLAGGSPFEERQKLLEIRDVAGRLLSSGDTCLRALRGETVRGEIIQLLFKQTRERRSYRLTAAPLRNGDVSSAVAVMADVTEDVYTERLKRELLAALAHELKTPIATVKGYAQYLGKLPEVSSQPRIRMLAAVERASNRLERLTNDLIDVSGLTLGHLVLAREQVDLAALARSVVEGIRRTSWHPIYLDAPEPAPVVADCPRIEQAIRRLVDNAIRYSPSGGDVEVEVRLEPESVRLSVRDHGIGIAAEQQPHIFEMFFRAHAGTPHDVGGLGIGLFLARQITLRHGGDMWFESTEGQGSTFYMRLSRAPSP